MNGLGGALISLVRDLDPALMRLISVACYLLGLLAFVQGCARLLRLSEDRFHGPSAAGTALCFAVCLVMVSFPSWIAAGSESLFGAGTAASASLGHGSAGADYDALLGAVLTVVGWVGLLAFLRGVFVLRAAADGQPGASAGRAAMHMLGGVCAWHAESLIGAVQTSLGIQVLRIT
ncbi:MAG: hypothetical protein OXN81_04110 [Alphaproteobacteria bacterium]|nr:hypothetical protein [Alphaproteobacteria bacterium]